MECKTKSDPPPSRFPPKKIWHSKERHKLSPLLASLNICFEYMLILRKNEFTGLQV